ncbi:hypothetical protein CHS0354_041435 [Potamilus streckersoni]|uniref:Tectonic domain-containing protein n=1 Tax=Potamilus streckersoni TaxID=2493646 RepID=A0AAE0TAX6_9BIVA|nr:hypothetical protein CHS0354_041435 [Potamilus streckersoni]
MKAVLSIALVAYLLNATAAQDNASETVVTNPAFQEVAPCPCDLTSGKCDVGCCCDVSCSDDEKQTFTCIPGLEGGQKAPVKASHCESNDYNKADWFPILCVHFESNALLGFFYQWQVAIKTGLQAFLAKLSTLLFYSYSETEERSLFDAAPDGSQGYIYGISVKTVSPSTGSNKLGILALPQKTLTGQCLTTAPVRYLIDLNSSCSFLMTNALCSPESVFSARFFIQSSNSTQNLFLVAGFDTTAAETRVSYYKLVNSTSYVKSQQSFNQVVVPGQEYRFANETLPNSSCIDYCGNDKCTDYNAIPDPILIPPQPPSRSFVTPTLFSGTCSNAVVDVKYTITWQGRTIQRLEAVIFYGDISISDTVTTRYQVQYVYNYTGETNGTTDNFYNTSGSYERSGRTGYQFGEPVFSGSPVYNNSAVPPYFMYVNTNLSRQMTVFNTGADGLCLNARKKRLSFGEDISTSCSLYLNANSLTLANCNTLRKVIINKLNLMMPSEVLGRRGYNDPKNLNYWVDVLREDLTYYCIGSDLYPTFMSQVDNLAGICYNMTNGIHMDVMYAETGRSNNNSIYEIIGGRISYTKATWKINCSPVNSGCGMNYTQPFQISTTVRFIKVPGNTPAPVAIYFDKPEEDDPNLCPGDRCWDNLFYPWTQKHLGDTRNYTLPFFLICVLFLISYLMVTRPWW